MGGSLKFTYTGDASSAIREAARLEAEQKKIEKATGRVAIVSVTAAGKIKVALGKQISKTQEAGKAAGSMGRAYKAAGKVGADAMKNVRSTLVGAAGVTLAVGVVRSAYKEWEADIERISQKSSEFAKKIVRELLQAGDTIGGAAVSKLVKGIPDIPRDRTLEAFSGVRAGGPGIGDERRDELIKEVAQLALANEEVKVIGQLVGSLNKLVPGKSADDIVDLALAVRQAAGKDIDKVVGTRSLKGVGGLVATGAASPTEALALSTAAFRADLAPTFVGQLAESVNQGVTLTDKSSEAAVRFQEAGAKKRLSLLLTDPATQQVKGLLEKSTALSLKQLDLKDVAALTKAFQEAQTGDLAIAQDFRTSVESGE